jgi:hypothetical protein
MSQAEEIRHIRKTFQGAFVNFEGLYNLYVLNRLTPWSFTNADPYELQSEIEKEDRRQNASNLHTAW